MYIPTGITMEVDNNTLWPSITMFLYKQGCRPLPGWSLGVWTTEASKTSSNRSVSGI